jgi:uncharacterized GH25 family protein
MRNPTLNLVMLGLFSLGSKPGMTHDILLLPRTAGDHVELTVKYGHPQDYEYADLDKLLELNVSSGNGRLQNVHNLLKRDGDNLMLPAAAITVAGDITLVSARYDNGYFVQLSGEKGSFNTSKLSFPNVKSSGYYFKFAKGMTGSATASGFDRDLSMKLEIIPLANPFALKPGGRLAVLVKSNGQPLANNKGVEIGDGETKIEEDKIPRYATDAQGRASVPISKTGWQILAIDLDEPSTQPQLAETNHYSATFSFYLPSK